MYLLLWLLNTHGVAICAAGATVYMGGAPADVKTGALYPCCTIGTATTLKGEVNNKKRLILCYRGI